MTNRAVIGAGIELRRSGPNPQSLLRTTDSTTSTSPSFLHRNGWNTCDKSATPRSAPSGLHSSRCGVAPHRSELV